MRNVIFFLFSVVNFYCSAQSYPSVAEILVNVSNPKTEGNGGGLVISSTSNQILILTANHVVANADSVVVTLNMNNKPRDMVAVVYKQNGILDISVLMVAMRGANFHFGNFLTELRPGDPAHIFSPRLDFQIIPIDGSGQITNVEQHEISCKLSGIESGDSGSPVWVDGAFGGIVLEKDAIFISASRINEELNRWGIHWKWKPIYPSTRQILIDKLPGTNLSADFQVTKVKVVEGSFVRLQCAIDKQTSTSCLTETKGWNGLSCELGTRRPISRVKMHYPSGIEEDLPVGYFSIPESKSKVSFNRALSHFESTATGSWFVYNLPEITITDRIEIFVKVRTDGNNKPIPTCIYEVQILGAEAK